MCDPRPPGHPLLTPGGSFLAMNGGRTTMVMRGNGIVIYFKVRETVGNCFNIKCVG